MPQMIVPVQVAQDLFRVDNPLPVIQGTPQFVGHFRYPGILAGEICGSMYLQSENLLPDAGNDRMIDVNYIAPRIVGAIYTQAVNQMQGVPTNIQGTLAVAQYYANLAQTTGKVPGSP